MENAIYLTKRVHYQYGQLHMTASLSSEFVLKTKVFEKGCATQSSEIIQIIDKFLFQRKKNKYKRLEMKVVGEKKVKVKLKKPKSKIKLKLKFVSGTLDASDLHPIPFNSPPGASGKCFFSK